MGSAASPASSWLPVVDASDPEQATNGVIKAAAKRPIAVLRIPYSYLTQVRAADSMLAAETHPPNADDVLTEYTRYLKVAASGCVHVRERKFPSPRVIAWVISFGLAEGAEAATLSTDGSRGEEQLQPVKVPTAATALLGAARMMTIVAARPCFEVGSACR